MLNVMKYVYAVYQEKSFSKAAKKLFISQPALSTMIKKAENQIGCPIFDRSTIPLKVTTEGQYYIDNIEKVLQINSNMENYYKDINATDIGNLSIGGSSYFCAYLLADIIAKFKSKYSKVRINLYEANIDELYSWLNDDTLDLIVETAVTEKYFKSVIKYEIGQEDIIIAVPKKFAINNELTEMSMTFKDVKNGMIKNENTPAVTVEAFKDQPFLMLRKGNDLFDRGNSICKNAGFSPKIVMELDQIMTSFYLAQAGAGIIFARASLCDFLPENDNLLFYKIGDPLAKRPIFAAVKRGRYLSKVAKNFLSALNVDLDTTKIIL